MTTTEMLDQLKYLYQQEIHALDNVAAIQKSIEEIRNKLINALTQKP